MNTRLGNPLLLSVFGEGAARWLNAAVGDKTNSSALAHQALLNTYLTEIQNSQQQEQIQKKAEIQKSNNKKIVIASFAIAAIIVFISIKRK